MRRELRPTPVHTKGLGSFFPVGIQLHFYKSEVRIDLFSIFFCPYQLLIVYGYLVKSVVFFQTVANIPRSLARPHECAMIAHFK